MALPGPAIVVTGAASPLGRELARLAALEGNPLVLVDDPGEHVSVAELEQYGVPVAVAEIELNAPDALDCLQSALDRRGLYCDILINGAATAVIGPLRSTSRRKQMDAINLNIRALTQLTLGVVPAMVKRRQGGVLNVGSTGGRPVCSDLAVYYASKQFVNAFSAALAHELAGTRVTVTCVAAGLITESLGSWAHEPALALLPQSTAIETAVSAWLGFKSGQRVVVPKLANQLVASMGKWLPARLAKRLAHATLGSHNA